MRRQNLPSNAPGYLIHEELEARNWTQQDLAEVTGISAGRVNNIISAKRSMSTGMARALAAAFGTSAQFWMKMDSAYQLSKKVTP